MQLPQTVKTVLSVLNEGGYEAYAVGGCVRDHLLGRVPSDWDVTTAARPEECLRLFRDYHVIETGLQHGTVTVMMQGEPIEVTTYRVDGTYSDHRHPDVVCFTHSLKEDLARRDFTVNAMAYHPNEGLIDPFDGEQDLQHRVIRCVGDPKRRFDEDALRILRAVRFASVLGFEVEPTTAETARALAETLHHIARERIAAEFQKLLCGKAAQAALLQFPGVIAVCVPSLQPLTANPNMWYDRVLEVVQGEADPAIRFALLLRDTNVRQATEQLRLDRKTADRVRLLAEAPRTLPQVSRLAVRRGAAAFGTENWQLYLRMFPPAQSAALRAETEAMLRDGDCCSLQALAIDGQKLIAAGFSRGKSVGQALQFALQAVINGTLPNDEAALLQACLQAEQNNIWHENSQK